MDKDEIIRMAREADVPFETETDGSLYGMIGRMCNEDFFKFAALVAAHEREACAKVCEEEASRAKWNWDNDISGNQPFWNGAEQLASSCAAAIRARGDNK